MLCIFQVLSDACQEPFMQRVLVADDARQNGLISAFSVERVKGVCCRCRQSPNRWLVKWDWLSVPCQTVSLKFP